MSAGRAADSAGCNAWTSALTAFGALTVGVNGELISNAPATNCSQARPLAGCAGLRAVRVRGATAATFTGSLGGRPGANAKCQAEFGGAAHFCHAAEYLRAASALPMPAASAWIDRAASPVDGSAILAGLPRAGRSAAASGCNAWTSAQTFNGSLTVSRTGELTSNAPGVDCSQARPIACCE